MKVSISLIRRIVAKRLHKMERADIRPRIYFRRKCKWQKKLALERGLDLAKSNEHVGDLSIQSFGQIMHLGYYAVN